jgi:hypothetical protein
MSNRQTAPMAALTIVRRRFMVNLARTMTSPYMSTDVGRETAARSTDLQRDTGTTTAVQDTLLKPSSRGLRSLEKITHKPIQGAAVVVVSRHRLHIGTRSGHTSLKHDSDEMYAMTPSTLRSELETLFPVGTVFDNPGGGTSTIVGYNDDKVSYVRGRSRMYLSYSDILAAYDTFHGKRVTTTALKKFAPAVFDSEARPAGHSCHCTTLFVLLGGLGLADGIQGNGVRGNPFTSRFSPKTP